MREILLRDLQWNITHCKWSTISDLFHEILLTIYLQHFLHVVMPAPSRWLILSWLQVDGFIIRLIHQLKYSLYWPSQVHRYPIFCVYCLCRWLPTIVKAGQGRTGPALTLRGGTTRVDTSSTQTTRSCISWLGESPSCLTALTPPSYWHTGRQHGHRPELFPAPLQRFKLCPSTTRYLLQVLFCLKHDLKTWQHAQYQVAIMTLMVRPCLHPSYRLFWSLIRAR